MDIVRGLKTTVVDNTVSKHSMYTELEVGNSLESYNN